MSDALSTVMAPETSSSTAVLPVEFTDVPVNIVGLDVVPADQDSQLELIDNVLREISNSPNANKPLIININATCSSTTSSQKQSQFHFHGSCVVNIYNHENTMTLKPAVNMLNCSDFIAIKKLCYLPLGLFESELCLHIGYFAYGF